MGYRKFRKYSKKREEKYKSGESSAEKNKSCTGTSRNMNESNLKRKRRFSDQISNSSHRIIQVFRVDSINNRGSNNELPNSKRFEEKFEDLCCCAVDGDGCQGIPKKVNRRSSVKNNIHRTSRREDNVTLTKGEPSTLHATPTKNVDVSSSCDCEVCRCSEDVNSVRRISKHREKNEEKPAQITSSCDCQQCKCFEELITEGVYLIADKSCTCILCNCPDDVLDPSCNDSLCRCSELTSQTSSVSFVAPTDPECDSCDCVECTCGDIKEPSQEYVYKTDTYNLETSNQDESEVHSVDKCSCVECDCFKDELHLAVTSCDHVSSRDTSDDGADWKERGRKSGSDIRKDIPRENQESCEFICCREELKGDLKSVCPCYDLNEKYNVELKKSERPGCCRRLFCCCFGNNEGENERGGNKKDGNNAKSRHEAKYKKENPVKRKASVQKEEKRQKKQEKGEKMRTRSKSRAEVKEQEKEGGYCLCCGSKPKKEENYQRKIPSVEENVCRRKSSQKYGEYKECPRGRVKARPETIPRTLGKSPTQHDDIMPVYDKNQNESQSRRETKEHREERNNKSEQESKKFEDKKVITENEQRTTGCCCCSSDKNKKEEKKDTKYCHCKRSKFTSQRKSRKNHEKSDKNKSPRNKCTKNCHCKRSNKFSSQHQYRSRHDKGDSTNNMTSSVSQITILNCQPGPFLGPSLQVIKAARKNRGIQTEYDNNNSLTATVQEREVGKVNMERYSPGYHGFAKNRNNALKTRVKTSRKVVEENSRTSRVQESYVDPAYSLEKREVLCDHRKPDQSVSLLTHEADRNRNNSPGPYGDKSVESDESSSNEYIWNDVDLTERKVNTLRNDDLDRMMSQPLSKQLEIDVHLGKKYDLSKSEVIKDVLMTKTPGNFPTKKQSRNVTALGCDHSVLMSRNKPSSRNNEAFEKSNITDEIRRPSTFLSTVEIPPRTFIGLRQDISPHNNSSESSPKSPENLRYPEKNSGIISYKSIIVNNVKNVDRECHTASKQLKTKFDNESATHTDSFASGFSGVQDIQEGDVFVHKNVHQSSDDVVLRLPLSSSSNSIVNRHEYSIANVNKIYKSKCPLDGLSKNLINHDNRILIMNEERKVRAPHGQPDRQEPIDYDESVAKWLTSNSELNRMGSERIISTNIAGNLKDQDVRRLTIQSGASINEQSTQSIGLNDNSKSFGKGSSGKMNSKTNASAKHSENNVLDVYSTHKISEQSYLKTISDDLKTEDDVVDSLPEETSDYSAIKSYKRSNSRSSNSGGEKYPKHFNKKDKSPVTDSRISLKDDSFGNEYDHRENADLVSSSFTDKETEDDKSDNNSSKIKTFERVIGNSIDIPPGKSTVIYSNNRKPVNKTSYDKNINDAIKNDKKTRKMSDIKLKTILEQSISDTSEKEPEDQYCKLIMNNYTLPQSAEREVENDFFRSKRPGREKHGSVYLRKTELENDKSKVRGIKIDHPVDSKVGKDDEILNNTAHEEAEKVNFRGRKTSQKRHGKNINRDKEVYTDQQDRRNNLGQRKRDSKKNQNENDSDSMKIGIMKSKDKEHMHSSSNSSIMITSDDLTCCFKKVPIKKRTKLSTPIGTLKETIQSQKLQTNPKTLADDMAVDYSNTTITAVPLSDKSNPQDGKKMESSEEYSVKNDVMGIDRDTLTSKLNSCDIEPKINEYPQKTFFYERRPRVVDACVNTVNFGVEKSIQTEIEMTIKEDKSFNTTMFYEDDTCYLRPTHDTYSDDERVCIALKSKTLLQDIYTNALKFNDKYIHADQKCNNKHVTFLNPKTSEICEISKGEEVFADAGVKVVAYHRNFITESKAEAETDATDSVATKSEMAPCKEKERGDGNYSSFSWNTTPPACGLTVSNPNNKHGATSQSSCDGTVMKRRFGTDTSTLKKTMENINDGIHIGEGNSSTINKIGVSTTVLKKSDESQINGANIDDDDRSFGDNQIRRKYKSFKEFQRSNKISSPIRRGTGEFDPIRNGTNMLTLGKKRGSEDILNQSVEINEEILVQQPHRHTWDDGRTQHMSKESVDKKKRTNCNSRSQSEMNPFQKIAKPLKSLCRNLLHTAGISYKAPIRRTWGDVVKDHFCFSEVTDNKSNRVDKEKRPSRRTSNDVRDAQGDIIGEKRRGSLGKQNGPRKYTWEDVKRDYSKGVRSNKRMALKPGVTNIKQEREDLVESQ